MNQRAILHMPGPAFWNLAAMAVFGYGGLALLVPTSYGLGRMAPALGNIGVSGLAVLLISSGTLGLLLLRTLFVKRGWWHEALVLGFCLNLACGADAVRLGQLQLAELVTTIAAVEFLLTRFVLGTEANATDEHND